MKKILVVDDQVGMRVMLEQVFLEGGYPVVTVENALQALDKWEEYQPDLVLIDMKMPGMSGVEFAQEVKKRSHQARLILMTAYSDQRLLEDAKGAGIEDYIIKPFNIDELLDLFQKIGLELQVS